MAARKKQDTYIRHARVLKVTDGDTVTLDVDLGCDIRIAMKCRLDGVNAPEKNTVEGMVARTWMEEKLPIGKEVVIQTVKDKKEKYGRYLATIFIPESTISINDMLKIDGIAKEYHGEART